MTVVIWKESNVSREIEKCEKRKIERVIGKKKFYVREATLHFNKIVILLEKNSRIFSPIYFKVCFGAIIFLCIDEAASLATTHNKCTFETKVNGITKHYVYVVRVRFIIYEHALCVSLFSKGHAVKVIKY